MGLIGPEMIPIFGIFMIIAIVIGPIWINAYFRSRERAQLHETLRKAYEQGQPPPAELIDKLTGESQPAPSSRVDSDLRRAVVLIAVGVGVAFLGLGIGWGIDSVSDIGGHVTGGIIAGSGAVPGFIGVAYFFLWLVGRRRPHV
jgi:hypothetical protein